MADPTTRTGRTELTAETLSLGSLSPVPGSTKARKRVGRGQGSGTGKTSGRGQKGQGSRSGGGVRPGFEGGQMPLHMRLGKLRGPNNKTSMPIGPFRTKWRVVSVGELDTLFGAGAEVTPEALMAVGKIPNLRDRVKVLGDGEVTKKLTVRLHGASKTAVAKLEAAGGSASSVDFVERDWRARSVAARAEA